MENCYRLRKENPKKNANFLSKLTFIWMIKLFYKKTKQSLDIPDIYKNLDHDGSKYLTDKLQGNWDEEVLRAKLKGFKPSLLRAIRKTFFWSYMFVGVAIFINFVGLRTLLPVILARLINLFRDDAENSKDMYILAGIMCFMLVNTCFINHHCNVGAMSIGMRVRIATSSLIYRKVLKLNQRSLAQTAVGHVVNLLSNDVSRFDMVTSALHYLWLTPFQMCAVTYLMWGEVGVSCLAGVLLMAALTLPFQGYLGKITSGLRLKVAQSTDYRVKVMSEILAGIQVIKMYAWEKPFEKVVKFARKREIKVLRHASYIRGIMMSSMVFIERATLFVTICCFVLLGNDITADKVFSMAQFFNLLQLSMAIMYPMAISLGAETLVSIDRLQNFLIQDEKETYEMIPSEDQDIVVQNVEASWTQTSTTIQIGHLRIAAGSLCAVIGPVGAGKSSLLQLLLGELKPTSGTVKLSGDISYSSQEPWCFVSSVRENILFGQEFHKSHYTDVVNVCALQTDFQQFPESDKTSVGERGVSLSGGQRARINLARAVYRDADIYLLDDPLSAVDTHVGKHLFEKCILEHLKGKTRILVTHQLQHLKRADLIVVLNQGRIEAHGTYEELSSSNLDFTELMVAADESPAVQKPEAIIEVVKPQRPSLISNLSFYSQTISPSEEDVGPDAEELSQVSGTPFKDYIGSVGNICLLLTTIFIVVLAQVLCSAADYWVTFWTQQEHLRNTARTNFTDTTVSAPTINEIEVFDQNKPDSYYSYVPAIKSLEEIPNEINRTLTGDFWSDIIYKDDLPISIIKTDISMYVYSILIVAAIIMTLGRSFMFFNVAMKASENLHSKMFHSLLKTPMSFFDKNPSGRILNRFSKDMGAIDELLPRVLMDSVQIILVMCGILVMVALSNVYMIVIMALLGLIFMKLRSWFIVTAKEIKHIEGIAKSPVYSHLSSTLNGIITIRASKIEDVLMQQFDEHQDVHTSAWYLTIMCTVSFGLWLDLICVLFVACVTFGFIILNNYSQVSGSLVGLAISQSLILVGMVQYGMRQTAEVVNNLTSVERVMQYTKLEKEQPLTTPKDKELPDSWPSEGKIELINLFLRYSPNDAAVLNNLNVLIQAREKIGIVGRTGAGKSSLISVLFRLAPIEGYIRIDDVNTEQLGLQDLRKRISIIPQEPVLFSATMRYNLDPFDEFEDDNLWQALEEVKLKEEINSLDYMVTEGGSNFSLGQRQLICLARAILRNNKLLVLDEATANVDPRTDALIQTTIRQKFKTCTVLTIAHRLNTIMDSDKILVMEAGCIVEFDAPHILLQNRNGYFHKMLAETGPTMSETLKEIAAQSYILRKEIG